jgi:hypothetical protein
MAALPAHFVRRHSNSAPPPFQSSKPAPDLQVDWLPHFSLTIDGETDVSTGADPNASRALNVGIETAASAPSGADVWVNDGSSYVHDPAPLDSSWDNADFSLLRRGGAPRTSHSKLPSRLANQLKKTPAYPSLRAAKEEKTDRLIRPNIANLSPHYLNQHIVPPKTALNCGLGRDPALRSLLVPPTAAGSSGNSSGRFPLRASPVKFARCAPTSALGGSGDGSRTFGSDSDQDRGNFDPAIAARGSDAAAWRKTTFQSAQARACWFCSARQDVTMSGARNLRNFSKWVLSVAPAVSATEIVELGAIYLQKGLAAVEDRLRPIRDAAGCAADSTDHSTDYATAHWVLPTEHLSVLATACGVLNNLVHQADGGSDGAGGAPTQLAELERRLPAVDPEADAKAAPVVAPAPPQPAVDSAEADATAAAQPPAPVDLSFRAMSRLARSAPVPVSDTQLEHLNRQLMRFLLVAGAPPPHASHHDTPHHGGLHGSQGAGAADAADGGDLFSAYRPTGTPPRGLPNAVVQLNVGGQRQDVFARVLLQRGPAGAAYFREGLFIASDPAVSLASKRGAFVRHVVRMGRYVGDAAGGMPYYATVPPDAGGRYYLDRNGQSVQVCLAFLRLTFAAAEKAEQERAVQAAFGEFAATGPPKRSGHGHKKHGHSHGHSHGHKHGGHGGQGHGDLVGFRAEQAAKKAAAEEAARALAASVELDACRAAFVAELDDAHLKAAKNEAVFLKVRGRYARVRVCGVPIDGDCVLDRLCLLLRADASAAVPGREAAEAPKAAYR